MKLIRLSALLAAALLLLCGCGYIIIEDYETRGSLTSGPEPYLPSELTLAPAETLPGQEAVLREPRTEEAKARLESVYFTDLTNSNLLIAVSTDADDSLFSDETDPFFDFYSIRNEWVTDRYGFALTVMKNSPDQMRAGLAASVKSGGVDSDYYADIIEADAKMSGSLAVAGLLMNLKKLPFYEIPSEGYEACGIYGTSCYFDISEATAGYSQRPALYMNTSLAGRELSDQISVSAIRGSFGFEELLSAVADAALPENCAGLCVSFGDAGYAGIGDIAAARLGISFTGRVSGYPAVTYVSSGEAAELSSLLTLLREISLITEPSADGDPAFDAFREEKALFYVGRLSDIATSLRNEKVRWQVLPLPSGKAGTCCTLSAENRAVLTVPSNNRRIEATALFLESVGAATGGWIGDMYANRCLESSLFRNNNSYFTLLALIDEPVCFDFVYICGDECKNLSEATVLAARTCAISGTPVEDIASPLLADLAKAIKKISLKQ